MQPIVYIGVGIGGCIALLVTVWIICKCRKRSRLDYSAIDEERSLLQKWEEEKKTQKSVERDAVLLNCYYYLKDSDMYSVVNHMHDMGSRINKHWFVVRNSKTHTEALLTMLPWSQQCILPYTKQTKTMLSHLFDLLEHPYLSTIISLDFMLQHQLVVIIQPYMQAGSLKDLIYGSRPGLPWLEKYEVKGKALALTQIKNYGRQILEAMIYLRQKGLPPCTHVHSGNVFVVGGICKFSGYEYTLLGHKARLHPFFKKLLKDNEDAAEIVAFGHLLFEMAAGYEMSSPEPVTERLVSCRSTPVVEALNFIFFNESGSYPYLEEVAGHVFFKDADVSHLRKVKSKQPKLSPSIKAMLKLFKKEDESSLSRRRKLSHKRSRAESASAGAKKERKASRSKSKRNSVDSALPEVTFRTTPSAPYPPPASFGSPPPPLPVIPQTINEHARPRPHATKDRGALLTSIRKGAKLKKTQTNDKSAPRI